MGVARVRAIAVLRDHLGETEVGRAFGLARLQNVEDLRASIPIMDPDTHARDVERRLGFSIVDPADPLAAELSGAGRERDEVVSRLRQLAGRDAMARTVVLRGVDPDPIVDRILFADLQAPAGALTRLDRFDDLSGLAESVADLDPELLVVSSTLVCTRLERIYRAPLERRLRSLRLVLAEHDLHHRPRTRVPVRGAGWIHATGRLGLPGVTTQASESTLAVGSQILELLPHSDPEEDGRRTYAGATVLPEHAVVGGRYELVLTSALGYLRVRTGEHVRVTGFDPPSEAAPFPRPRVVRLPPVPDDLKLEGCTLAGAWLTASVRQAFRPEDPALVAAEIVADPESFPPGAARSTASMRLPAAFADTEIAFKARLGQRRVGRRASAVLVRVEVQGHADRGLPAGIGKRVDESLRRRSPAYSYLRERGELHGPRVMLLPVGTYREEEDRRVLRLRGGVWVPEVRVVTST